MLYMHKDSTPIMKNHPIILYSNFRHEPAADKSTFPFDIYIVTACFPHLSANSASFENLLGSVTFESA